MLTVTGVPIFCGKTVYIVQSLSGDFSPGEEQQGCARSSCLPLLINPPPCTVTGTGPVQAFWLKGQVGVTLCMASLYLWRPEGGASGFDPALQTIKVQPCLQWTEHCTNQIMSLQWLKLFTLYRYMYVLYTLFWHLSLIVFLLHLQMRGASMCSLFIGSCILDHLSSVELEFVTSLKVRLFLTNRLKCSIYLGEGGDVGRSHTYVSNVCMLDCFTL